RRVGETHGTVLGVDLLPGGRGFDFPTPASIEQHETVVIEVASGSVVCFENRQQHADTKRLQVRARAGTADTSAKLPRWFISCQRRCSVAWPTSSLIASTA